MSETVKQETRRVLVVDDNVDAAEMMGTVLELHGHEVRLAYDGSGALKAAREWAPDVAVLDIGLPDLDGYELARQFRSGNDTRGVRLIAVTGWGQDEDRLKAAEAGFDAHLTKPADLQKLLAALSR